ncbi:hypothetical protein FE257_006765 [Aspergillus nanangensis]|uniref:Uncharacterized protein n=1 Tax=Aspergillus nanangensis TaxID=2582783 RepID=A0AAD4CQD2_ASPNN|nr:hypothetical protein FE257_006765 [Aspergillus nanangensis]
MPVEGKLAPDKRVLAEIFPQGKYFETQPISSNANSCLFSVCYHNSEEDFVVDLKAVEQVAIQNLANGALLNIVPTVYK